MAVNYHYFHKYPFGLNLFCGKGFEQKKRKEKNILIILLNRYICYIYFQLEKRNKTFNTYCNVSLMRTPKGYLRGVAYI